MSVNLDSKCPECGERLSLGAIRCACGWSQTKPRKDGRTWDHLCLWNHNQVRCKYPVARFDVGSSSGYCVFHRNCGDQLEGWRIVQESQGATSEQYVARAKALVYGNGNDNPSVAETRAHLHIPKDHGPKVKLPRHMAPRQPGDDESEAA